jgi:hypothetical protein
MRSFMTLLFTSYLLQKSNQERCNRYGTTKTERKFLDVKPKGGGDHLGEVNVPINLIAIRIDIAEMQQGGVKWIQVSMDRIQKQDFVQNLTLSLSEKQLREDAK